MIGPWRSANRLIATLKQRTTAARRTTLARDRFLRWQQTAITQFGFVTNTVLVLTTASIAFAFSQAASLNDNPRKVLLFGILSLGTSGLLALLSSWNRLLDFRLTAQIARATEQYDVAEIRDEAKTTVRNLGDLSYCLVKWQFITFGIGVLIVALVLFCSLWPWEPCAPHNLGEATAAPRPCS